MHIIISNKIPSEPFWSILLLLSFSLTLLKRFVCAAYIETSNKNKGTVTFFLVVEDSYLLHHISSSKYINMAILKSASKKTWEHKHCYPLLYTLNSPCIIGIWSDGSKLTLSLLAVCVRSSLAMVASQIQKRKKEW